MDAEPRQGINAKHVLYIICVVLALIGVYSLASYKPYAPTGFAAYDSQIADNYIKNPDEMKTAYNKRSDEVPGFVKWLFGDERLDITLTRLEGETVRLAVETENGDIKEIQKGEMTDPTMHVWLDESTIKKIYESENPVDELEQAIEDDKIKYKNEKIITSIKTSILNAAINVLSWFS